MVRIKSLRVFILLLTLSTTRDLTMSINVKGVWYGSKYAILAMRENKPDPAKGLQTGGSIINVASFVALMGAGTPQLACEPMLVIPVFFSCPDAV